MISRFKIKRKDFKNKMLPLVFVSVLNLFQPMVLMVKENPAIPSRIQKYFWQSKKGEEC